MTLPLALVAELAMGLVQGPLSRVLENHVSDLELRQKIAAELKQETLSYVSKSADLGTGIVLAEAQSEHWFTRSWRPMLMVILMGFLVLAGIVLPTADLLVGHHINFQPRWQVLPENFWDFLTVGMGGYIGGRSLEKVAGLVAPALPGQRNAIRNP